MIAASLLVVLTTFSINMLTATGDLNQLLVQWSQNNANSSRAISLYLEDDEDLVDNYEEYSTEQMYTGDAISELMSGSPNKELIFNEFNLENIHPNEITGLIRIFDLFKHTPEVQQIKRTWFDISQISSEKNQTIDSLIASKESGNVIDDASLRSLDQLDQEINTHIRAMISDNAIILTLLKRYSLWFTVLLGILIVLIGVIYTVRGLKSIKRMQQLLSEREYLAMFPELNQFPVLNLSVEGKIAFLNQAAKDLFPELEKSGLQHPFMNGLKTRFNEIIKNPENTLLYEVEVNGSYYQQVAHFLSKQKGIHIHSIDITELKKKQLELSHTLKEKESLLAEVHHRVKNNMAVITGLLELQEMMGQDPDSALSESRSRIKSMAIVHELLYQSDSFSTIDTKQYLSKLGEHLKLSLSNIDSVNVLNGASNRSLNINQAIPLGLLLNELAFYLCQQSSSKNQQLELELQIINTGELTCLRISSLQPDVANPLKRDGEPTLRMSLIKNLLAQIEGELVMPESKSLLIEIHFSPNIKKGSSSTYI
jgi:two-component sensor histidine kinase